MIYGYDYGFFFFFSLFPLSLIFCKTSDLMGAKCYPEELWAVKMQSQEKMLLMAAGNSFEDQLSGL